MPSLSTRKSKGQGYAKAICYACGVERNSICRSGFGCTNVNADLSAGAFTFSNMGVSFTFGSTGDVFNPLSVSNGAGGAISSFGGFLGIPVTPSSSFTDRGTVTYGPGDSFASFLSATTVPYSNNGNFLGLRATSGNGDFFGYAYTVDNILVSYGFENQANTRITATTAVPEPAAWAMMIGGFGLVGGAMRRRKAQVRTSVAFA